MSSLTPPAPAVTARGRTSPTFPSSRGVVSKSSSGPAVPLLRRRTASTLGGGGRGRGRVRAAAAAAAAALRLTSELEGAGPNARVVGGHPALGAWTVQGGVRNGDAIELTDVGAVDQVLEYKWHDGSSWEEGGNRELRLPGASGGDGATTTTTTTTLALTVVDRAAHFPAAAAAAVQECGNSPFTDPGKLVRDSVLVS